MMDDLERDEINALLQHAARIRSDIKKSLQPCDRIPSTVKCAGCDEDNSIYSSWCIRCGLKPGDPPPKRVKDIIKQKHCTVFNSEQILYKERIQTTSPPRGINTTTPPKSGRSITLSYIKKQDDAVTPPLIDKEDKDFEDKEDNDFDIEKCEANLLQDVENNSSENITENEMYTSDIILYDRSDPVKHKKKLYIKPISSAKPPTTQVKTATDELKKSVQNAWVNPVCNVRHKQDNISNKISAESTKSNSVGYARQTQSRSNLNDTSNESSIITRLNNATKRPSSSNSKRPSSAGPNRSNYSGPKRPNSADQKRPGSAGPKRAASPSVFERLYNNESRTKERFSSSMPHLIHPTLKTSTVSLASPQQQLSLQTNSTKPKKKAASSAGQKPIKAFPKTMCGYNPLIIKGQSSPIPQRRAVKIQSTKSEEEVDWLSLPAEIWLHILSFLQTYSQVSLVCSQLYEIVQDPSLWDRVNIVGLTLSDEHLISIGQRQPRTLTFTTCKGDNITSTGLRALFRSCEDTLETLLVSECTGGELISSSLLLHLSARCRNLHNIHLSWCNVTDDALTRTAERSHRLNSVCIPGCRNITDISFRIILQRHYTSLSRIDLSGCFNISPSAIQQLSHCPHLSELYLGNCSQITDLTLTTLSVKCTNLKVLDLRGCKRITEQGISSLLRNNPCIHTLSLAYVTHLTDTDIENISNSVVSLSIVDLSGCAKVSSNGIKSLTRHPIKALDLGSTAVSYRGCGAIANYLSNSLQELSLNCTDVNDECMKRIVSKCKKLARVSIFGCRYIRDLSFLYHLNPLMILEC